MDLHGKNYLFYRWEHWAWWHAQRPVTNTDRLRIQIQLCPNPKPVFCLATLPEICPYSPHSFLMPCPNLAGRKPPLYDLFGFFFFLSFFFLSTDELTWSLSKNIFGKTGSLPCVNLWILIWALGNQGQLCLGWLVTWVPIYSGPAWPAGECISHRAIRPMIWYRQHLYLLQVKHPIWL